MEERQFDDDSRISLDQRFSGGVRLRPSRARRQSLDRRFTRAASEDSQAVSRSLGQRTSGAVRQQSTTMLAAVERTDDADPLLATSPQEGSPRGVNPDSQSRRWPSGVNPDSHWSGFTPRGPPSCDEVPVGWSLPSAVPTVVGS